MNFYPRPPRGGRRRRYGATPEQSGISIHALREEGDAKQGVNNAVVGISIHALREEGDEDSASKLKEAMKFLSTPSARRAT